MKWYWHISVVLVLLVPILGCEKSTGESPKPAPTSAAASRTETESAGPTFYDLPFAEACAKAKQTGKLVLVDFYTTWCGPCKQLDRETWPDAAVEKWLRAKTVALKVDAEKQDALAARYSIRAYPTIVFMEPDGKEKARTLGFRPPKDFLAQAADVLAGISRADRLRQELKAGVENDPMKRMLLGHELAENGMPAEALEQYLWCFDHGDEHNPQYTYVRLTSLVYSIADLGRTYCFSPRARDDGLPSHSPSRRAPPTRLHTNPGKPTRMNITVPSIPAPSPPKRSCMSAGV